MKRKNKFFVFVGLIMTTILCVTGVSVHAEETGDYLTRLANSTSRAEDAGIHYEDTIWMTENIDPEKAVPFLAKYMMWEDQYMYTDNPDNDDVIFDYTLKKDIYGYTVTIHFKKGINQNTYGTMSRIKTIESCNGAEYIIGASDYDTYSIILDGNTYQGDLGPLLKDAIEKNRPRVISTSGLSIPYDTACDIYGNNISLGYATETDLKDYMIISQGRVGFNLTVDSYTPKINDSVDDDYEYGGDENNKLDPTPTQPESSDNTKFDLGQAIGITISVLSGIVILYVVYVLITKIYKLMKGK
ncbi:MAG: hypothetical protein K6C11_02875 [Bacilli bacterium]|nr:hypothetical protein [Bacilli bacterium]